MVCEADELESAQVIAHIRKNSTGEVREYPTEETFGWSDDAPGRYMWEMGNFSCDCNRHIFWLRSGGNDTEAATEVGCSEGKFSVNLQNPVTKEFFYKEFEI